ncbi:MAG: hypothetical protein AAFR97_02345, partial [Bacteroidota bacterium]
MRIFIHLFLLLFLFSSAVQAQSTDPFPTDEGTDAYLEALEDWMLASRNDRVNEAFELFYGLFLSGEFTEDEQLRIMETTNKMVERRIPKASGFIHYLGSLELVKRVSQDSAVFFNQYHDALAMLMAEGRFRVTQLDKTVNVAKAYYEDRRLSKDTRGTYWKVLGGNPSWLYDNGPKLRIDDADRMIAISGSDSMVIAETSVVIDVIEGNGTGEGGEVNWED